MLDLSVILCAHNPQPDLLRRTLDSLWQQTLSLKRWELLLVDNASSVPLASSYDLSCHPHARHVVESELGLSVARLRGMREAASDLLVFVDDDTLLDRDYLARAVEIKQEWPLLGIWGSGEVTAEYEVQPDESLVKLLPYLAIRQTEKPLWSNVAPCVEATPWGAGSCVRASVAEEYRRTNGGSEISITGRRGNALLSGEDRDIAYVACQMGLGTAVFPELRVTHVIPKHRISRKYLLKVYEGTEISDALLMYKWKGHMPMSPFRTRGLLSIMKIFLVRRGLDRQMHLAKVRAMISARQIIAAEKP